MTTLSSGIESFEFNQNHKSEKKFEENVNDFRKGWLMLRHDLYMDMDGDRGHDRDRDQHQDQDICGVRDGEKQWQKYWFVLCKRFLNSYRDQEAEDVGDFIHSIDLSSISTVTEDIQCNRNYGFQLQVFSYLCYNG